MEGALVSNRADVCVCFTWHRKRVFVVRSGQRVKALAYIKQTVFCRHLQFSRNGLTSPGSDAATKRQDLGRIASPERPKDLLAPWLSTTVNIEGG